MNHPPSPLPSLTPPLPQERRTRREATLARKEENRKKSEVTVRVSTQTAKRMQKSKKQRKALRTGQ